MLLILFFKIRFSVVEYEGWKENSHRSSARGSHGNSAAP